MLLLHHLVPDHLPIFPQHLLQYRSIPLMDLKVNMKASILINLMVI